MIAYKHVRFRLSQLAERVSQYLDEHTTQKDSLEFYWNWAHERGWCFVGMHARSVGETVAGGWDGVQLGANDEIWDVVWSGEDVKADATPDFLKSRGDGAGGLIYYEGDIGIPDSAIEDVSADTLAVLGVTEVVDQLIGNARMGVHKPIRSW
jgi:hypothetical protein